MHLALIGMSGIGKSYWATKLAEIGFEYYGCDDLIATKLWPDLSDSHDRLLAMANWMGFPHDSHYEPRAAQYLAYEVEVMQELMEKLRQASPDQKMVIDTTGSVIYVGEAVLTELKRLATLVYLDITPEVHEQMLQKFWQHPRPIIWQTHFQPAAAETQTQAIERCYPSLLTYRQQLYQHYSDVIIPYQAHQQFDLTASEFLQLITALR